MAKKKKFGWDDVAELAGHAATMVGHYQNAQAAAKKSFDDGNSTNLKGSEGGVSKKKLGNAQRFTGLSELNQANRNYTWCLNKVM